MEMILIIAILNGHIETPFRTIFTYNNQSVRTDSKVELEME